MKLLAMLVAGFWLGVLARSEIEETGILGVVAVILGLVMTVVVAGYILAVGLKQVFGQ